MSKEKAFTEIDQKKALEIISNSNAAEAGLFWHVDGDTYVGIDNTTHEAWTEEFSTKQALFDWLNGGETLGVIDDTPTVAALDPDTRENNPFAEEGVIACQFCRSGEWLYNEDGAPNAFCGQCGRRITWPEASEEAAARREKE